MWVGQPHVRPLDFPAIRVNRDARRCRPNDCIRWAEHANPAIIVKMEVDLNYGIEEIHITPKTAERPNSSPPATCAATCGLSPCCHLAATSHRGTSARYWTRRRDGYTTPPSS